MTESNRCEGCSGCVSDSGDARVLFTKEMKKTHTILFPTMLPMHFKLLSRIFNDYGYARFCSKTERTETRRKSSMRGSKTSITTPAIPRHWSSGSLSTRWTAENTTFRKPP